MNAMDVLHYGHLTVLQALDGLPEDAWDTSGVCGWWSVRQIIAHLASHELVLVDVLKSFLGREPTPCLAQFIEQGLAFNDIEVDKRAHMTLAETLAEYNEAHAHVMSLLPQVPFEKRRQMGALPWYGHEYDLEDFITYGFYGHKREHCAQINVFRDSLQWRDE